MKYKQLILFLGLIFSFYTCARVGRPTGGEKDILAPISISATPDFESLNFKGSKIKINFNEYIKFDDLNSQLVISPPLNNVPDISPLGFPSKQIIIKIKDTLKPNTTYTFNFGNAITDNSEGNPLKQFKYLFSTGDHIDSLEVSGTVQDAILSKTAANISVMLYEVDSTFTDSIVYKSRPDYVGNTIDSVGFSITNIKDGLFYLVGLKDANKNLLFDPKVDKIAFLNEPILVDKDSIYQLKLFLEQPQFAIKGITELSKNHLIIAYEGVLAAQVDNLVDNKNNTVGFISYKDVVTDSLHVWFKSIESDSVHIAIKSKDTLNLFSQKIRSEEFDSIQLTKNITNTLHLRDTLYILSNTPIASIDKSKIHLIDADSTDIEFEIRKNRLPDRFYFDFEKKESTAYTLSVLPMGIIDFLEQKNDSLLFKFNTKKIEDYGSINLKLEIDNTAVILELLSEKDKLIEKVFVSESKEFEFSNLQPGNYQLRATIDENGNNIWDTGNYLAKKQPERVIYYSKIIEVRANWTISEVFNLK